MDMILELLLDCVLSLVVDSGVEVMAGSESCRSWPKGVRIALVAVTLIVYIAVLGFLTIVGISEISEGKTAVGILLFFVALVFVIYPATRVIAIYKKKRN